MSDLIIVKKRIAGSAARPGMILEKRLAVYQSGCIMIGERMAERLLRDGSIERL